MKTIKIQYIKLLLLVLSISACRSYVDVEPIGNERELIYTSDYRALANNYSNLENGWSYPLLSSDDVEFSESFQAKVSDIWSRIYTWNNYFFDEGNQDSDWSNLYRTIYYSNAITDGVMGSKSGTETEKEEIMAEAKVHRAFAYLTLVNMYAPHYNPETASLDKAVPLKLTSDLYVKLNRVSVDAIYTQIISDLKDALPELPQLPEFNVLPSQAAVYALLARTYLYMGNYTEALTYAKDALELQNLLNDLNQFSSNPFGYPAKLDNPEIIFSKLAMNYYKGAPLSSDLLGLLKENDLRYDVYTTPGSSFYPTHEGRSFAIGYYSYTNGINVGPSVPEMMLIKAECQARLNDSIGAILTLNKLRSKRFDNSSDYEIVLGENESALDYVLRERRIELLGRGFRWFDLKRLNMESGREVTITRTFNSKIYTLLPNSELYVYPIFKDYIKKNPELGE